jgi:hypothetical protein
MYLCAYGSKLSLIFGPPDSNVTPPRSAPPLTRLRRTLARVIPFLAD